MQQKNPKLLNTITAPDRLHNVQVDLMDVIDINPVVNRKVRYLFQAIQNMDIQELISIFWWDWFDKKTSQISSEYGANILQTKLKTETALGEYKKQGHASSHHP